MTYLISNVIVDAVKQIGSGRGGQLSLIELIGMYATKQIHPSRTLWYDDSGGSLYLPLDRERWSLPYDGELKDEDRVCAFKFDFLENEFGDLLGRLGITAEHC